MLGDKPDAFPLPPTPGDKDWEGSESLELEATGCWDVAGRALCEKIDCDMNVSFEGEEEATLSNLKGIGNICRKFTVPGTEKEGCSP
jgi:hypothetical protein